MTLHPDGLFLNAGVHEPAACHDVEPLVGEEEALAIARAAYDEHVASRPAPIDSTVAETADFSEARLVYVATQKIPEINFWEMQMMLVYASANRLTWLIEPGRDCHSIRVDAMTGDLVGVEY